MANTKYYDEQLNDYLQHMSRHDLMRTLVAVAELAPDAVGSVLGITQTARLGENAHTQQSEILDRIREMLRHGHLGQSDSYRVLDDLSELASQDMRLAASGQYADGIGQLLEIVQLFPWLEERTRGVIGVGLSGMWLDSVAEELAPLPDTTDAAGAKAALAQAIADPEFTGVQKYLVQFQEKLS